MISPGLTDSSPRLPAARLFIAGLGFIVALLILSMMLLTFVDVVGRYFFNSPVPGSYELTEVLLAVAIFASLPLTTVRREHVTVEILDSLFKGPVRPVQQLLVGVVSFTALMGLAWRLWEQAGALAAYGDHTLFLHIPYAPVAYFMAAMCALSSLFSLGLTLSEVFLKRP